MMSGAGGEVEPKEYTTPVPVRKEEELYMLLWHEGMRWTQMRISLEGIDIFNRFVRHDVSPFY
jgi:hypothetical protein